MSLPSSFTSCKNSASDRAQWALAQGGFVGRRVRAPTGRDPGAAGRNQGKRGFNDAHPFSLHQIRRHARRATSTEGFIEIDIRALDIDGVTKLYVNLDDVANVKSKRDSAVEALDAWDSMFGKKDE